MIAPINGPMFASRIQSLTRPPDVAGQIGAALGCAPRCTFDHSGPDVAGQIGAALGRGLLSLVIPGLGQWTAKRYALALFFGLAAVLVWISPWHLWQLIAVHLCAALNAAFTSSMHRPFNPPARPLKSHCISRQ